MEYGHYIKNTSEVFYNKVHRFIVNVLSSKLKEI